MSLMARCLYTFGQYTFFKSDIDANMSIWVLMGYFEKTDMGLYLKEPVLISQLML